MRKIPFQTLALHDNAAADEAVEEFANMKIVTFFEGEDGKFWADSGFDDWLYWCPETNRWKIETDEHVHPTE
jgi:hypothetical protein